MLEPFEINFPNTFEFLIQLLQIKLMLEIIIPVEEIFEYVLIPREKGNLYT